MARRKRIPDETKATVRALKNTTHLTLEEIALRCNICKTSVQRIASAKDKVPENERRFCGRKKKITPEQEALILRSITELRDLEGSFSSRRLMERTGLIRHVTDRTVRRLLNRNGYFFLQGRKKGLMSQTDKDRRVEFAQKNTPRVFGQTLSLFTWMVSRSFTRQYPLDQARAPKGRVWRKRSEGLTQGCLAKGSKSGAGGRVAKLMVAISYGKGVVVCERYDSTQCLNDHAKD